MVNKDVYKQYPLTNGTTTHQWTIVYDASHRSYD